MRKGFELGDGDLRESLGLCGGRTGGGDRDEELDGWGGEGRGREARGSSCLVLVEGKEGVEVWVVDIREWKGLVSGCGDGGLGRCVGGERGFGRGRDREERRGRGRNDIE